ncbi:hypothetical protein C0991_000044 [Blastosporella zonata]|nr:hypothetical protein C0991_000044 [Blastosporella zonata]
MPQQSPSPTTAITSNTESPFVPRKEFIREIKDTPSSFAIVAISSANFVRLYSFPPYVVTTLRALLESFNLLVAFREDLQQHLCEFALNGKPWASPKSLKSEKLLIDIFAIIYQCGYTYLSSLDYGRETDDRLAMAFSKPSANGSRSATPLPRSASPFQDSSASTSSDRHRPRRSPFALSFLSPTLMHVIAPPLHLTPAILQAVRASWPRGVVSEKKIGDNSFEFRLKGYKWFQQDTFATDSLRHILSLLTSLDSQSFTLLTSISLTKRSRVKDLWVFTGPASTHADDFIPQESSAGNNFNSDVNRVEITSPLAQHRRLASEPTISRPHVPQHVRAATEQIKAQNFTLTHGYRAERPRMGSVGPALLRKPAPRAQVPVSVVHEIEPPGTEELRAHLPSVISTGVDDMTGVGANGFPPSVFYTQPLSDRPDIPTVPILPEHASSPPKSLHYTRSRSPLRSIVTRQKTPPILTSNTTHSSIAPAGQDAPLQPGGLLGVGTFRDSSISNASDTSFDIPIQWMGMDTIVTQNKGSNGREEQGPARGSPSRRRASSAGPMLPGGWQPTPIEEKPEGTFVGGAVDEQSESEPSASQNNNAGNKTPIHEVASCVASPELTRPDMPLRKSEAALVGLITNTQPLPLPRGGGSESQRSGNGKGWVLVNVGQSKNSSQVGLGGSIEGVNSPSSEHMAPNPHAKAIVAMDALDSQKKGKEKPDATTPFKQRLFGLGKKNSSHEEQNEESRWRGGRNKEGLMDSLAEHSDGQSELGCEYGGYGEREARRIINKTLTPLVSTQDSI